MPTPDYVSTPVDALAKIPGRDFIALQSPIQFTEDADRVAFKEHLGGSGGLQRAFRILASEDQVLYTDGGIGFTAPGAYVPLPAPDEGKIGALIRFYGDPSVANSCGFYTDGGNFVLLPNGDVTDYFNFGYGGIADAQLDYSGLWRVTIVQPGVNNVPYVSGSTTLAYVDGSRYYLGYLQGDTVLDLSGGTDGDTMEVAIGWTNASPTLDFSANIKMPVDLSAFLPITLDLYKSYSMTFVKRGGYWTLASPIQGPTVESED